MAAPDNAAKVVEYLDCENYVIRCWVPAGMFNTGHVSLETEKHYLGFWPRNDPKAGLKEIPGVFARSYEEEKKWEGGTKPLFKLIKVSKENIKKMDDECARLGAYNKLEKDFEPNGIKKSWFLRAESGTHDDSKIGSCSLLVQLVLDKTASAKNSWNAIGSAVGHIGVTVVYSYFGPPMYALLAATLPVMAVVVFAATGAGIVGSYLWRAQQNAGGGLRFTDSKYERFDGHYPTPENVYNLIYPGHKVRYDDKNKNWGKFVREQKLNKMESFAKISKS